MLKRWTTALRGALAVVIAGLATTAAQAQPFTFTQGNIIVQRTGGDANYGAGAAALSNAATAVFLDQFLPFTAAQPAPVNTAGANLSIALPTTVGNLAVTNAGNATSEGYFNRTVDGLGLVVGGYNAAVGTAAVSGTTPATNNRSIAIITDTAMVTTNGFSNGPTGSFRSVVAATTTGFLYASTAGSASATGMSIQPNTGTVTANTVVTNGNFRVAGIFNNTLFVSSGSASPGIGVSMVGTQGTLPTGSEGVTYLPGTGTSGASPNPYGFFLLNNAANPNNWNSTGLNTLYMADERLSASGGGIQRFAYDGTNWVLSGTVGAGANGVRGLTASYDAGTNTTTLWATTTQTSANQLVTVTDNLNTNTFGTMITLATAPVNTVFRGVSLAPVPEPATVLGIAAGAFGVGGLIRRKFRKTA